MLQRKLSKHEQNQATQRIASRAVVSLELLTFRSIIRGEHDIKLLTSKEETENRTPLSIVDGLLTVYNLPTGEASQGMAVAVRQYQNTYINYLLLSAIIPPRPTITCWVKVKLLCKSMINDLWATHDVCSNVIELCEDIGNLMRELGQPATSIDSLVGQVANSTLLMQEELLMLAIYLMNHDVQFWREHSRELFSAMERHSEHHEVERLMEAIIDLALPAQCPAAPNCVCLREDSMLTALLCSAINGNTFVFKSKHTDNFVPTYTLAHRILKQIYIHMSNSSHFTKKFLAHLSRRMEQRGHAEVTSSSNQLHTNQVLVTSILLRAYFPSLLRQAPNLLDATKFILHCSNNSEVLQQLDNSILTQKLYKLYLALGSF